MPRAVIVGVGQFIERPEDPEYRARSPVALAAVAARMALEDAQSSIDLTIRVDLVAGVRQIETSEPGAVARFGRSNNFPGSVMARLGCQPAQTWLEAPGGQSPQTLVAAVAEAIEAGSASTALIVGAETLSTQRHLVARGIAPDWSERIDGDPVERGGTFDDTLGDQLIRAQRFDAAAGYALFDQARRARLGLDRDQYRHAIGDLLAPFSRVAASNPHAALREAFSPADLATPGPRNRPVAEPYLRLTVARDLVNQAAAIVLTSAEQARVWGIAEDRWVYLHGHAQAAERPVLQRPDLSRSPAAVLTVQAALTEASCALEELNFLDLYSCFAAPVFNIIDAFELRVDDPRGLTVTGGLPFFGGPGNAYSLHAIVTMAERLRRAPGARGLIVANGGYMSKTAVGVYGSIDRPRGPHLASLQSAVDALPKRRVADGPMGAAVIESATVTYGRDGVPQSGLLIGSLTNGQRFLADVDERDVGRLVDVSNEPIGLTGGVDTSRGRSRFRLDRA